MTRSSASCNERRPNEPIQTLRHATSEARRTPIGSSCASNAVGRRDGATFLRLVPFGMSNVVLGASETEDAVPRLAAGIDKHRPAPGAAQLWVDPSGGSCVRRSNPAPWVDARACRSLWAAYKTARSVTSSTSPTGRIRVRRWAAAPNRSCSAPPDQGVRRFGQIVSAASDVTLRVWRSRLGNRCQPSRLLGSRTTRSLSVRCPADVRQRSHRRSQRAEH